MKHMHEQALNETVKPWTGRIDPHEMCKPGGRLMGALLACASDRGENINSLAQQLGIHPSYINQLRTGIRNVFTISDDLARSCAKYLGISMARVLLLAGRMQAADFHDEPEAFKQQLDRAMAAIQMDGRWGHLLTKELLGATPDSVHFLVRLYEAATGTRLMSECDSRELIAESLRAGHAVDTFSLVHPGGSYARLQEHQAAQPEARRLTDRESRPGR